MLLDVGGSELDVGGILVKVSLMLLDVGESELDVGGVGENGLDVTGCW